MQLNKKQIDIDFVRRWQARGIDPIVLSVLNRRGIGTDEELADMLACDEEAHLQPFDFTQVTTAYARIDKAVADNEKIIIYGDKDVDGTGSVAIITGWLEDIIAERKSKASFDWDVPTGSNHYGLDADKIQTWGGKYTLCITVDCGITNMTEIDMLTDIGIDTIVIDHHEALDIRPKCTAVINPMCEDGLNEKKICACVVTYLFIIGYCVRNSQYFDKKIGVIYVDNNHLNYDIYKNFIFVSRHTYARLSEVKISQADYNYFFSDKDSYTKEIKSFFDKNHIKPIAGEKLIDRLILQYHSDRASYVRTAMIKSVYADIPRIDELRHRYLPIAALGTMADVMPLNGINRAIVRDGLKMIRTGRLRNISKMVFSTNNDVVTLTSRDLSWGLCPLLNASGRMGDATITVMFLRDTDNSGFYLNAIIDNNNQRKKKEEEAIELFKKQFDDNPGDYKDVAFFYSDKIFRGVTGTVAAKMSEYTHMPAIAAAKDGDVYIGSMRGTPGISFVDFLSGCADLLELFGGHHDAAGFTLHEQHLEEFCSYLHLHGADLRPVTVRQVRDIDAEIPLSYLNLDLFSRLSILEPFGQNNEAPVLFTSGIEISSFSVMGKTNSHVKILFKTAKEPFVGIWWGKADCMKRMYRPGGKYDVLYTVEKNAFRGVVTIQMNIIDMELIETR